MTGLPGGGPRGHGVATAQRTPRTHLRHVPDRFVLPEVLAGIREGLWVPDNKKVCVVLDQFEQWLHARRGEQDTQLVQALRHCDGGRLQCLALGSR